MIKNFVFGGNFFTRGEFVLYINHSGKDIEINFNMKIPYIYIWNFYSKNNFKIQTCLFIIARFSASESLRVYPNILKIPHHSLVERTSR